MTLGPQYPDELTLGGVRPLLSNMPLNEPAPSRASGFVP
jgi:hypothetical protein